MISSTKNIKKFIKMSEEKTEKIYSCDLPKLLRDNGFFETEKLYVPSVIEEENCAQFGKITYLGKSEKGQPLYVVTDFKCMKAHMLGLGIMSLVGLFGAGYLGWALGSRKNPRWY